MKRRSFLKAVAAGFAAAAAAPVLTTVAKTAPLSSPEAEALRNGWSRSEFMGVQWIVTHKKSNIDNAIKDLMAVEDARFIQAVNAASPPAEVFRFADPKFIGKSYILEDATLLIKRESYHVEFYAYEGVGGFMGHAQALARASI